MQQHPSPVLPAAAAVQLALPATAGEQPLLLHAQQQAVLLLQPQRLEQQQLLLLLRYQILDLH
jgi:hypothetical protein